MYQLIDRPIHDCQLFFSMHFFDKNRKKNQIIVTRRLNRVVFIIYGNLNFELIHVTMRTICLAIFLMFSTVLLAQDFDAQLNKANSKFFDKDYNTALAEYQNLLESGVGDSIQRSWAYGYVGICNHELGNIEEAKKNYVEALNLGTPGPSFYSKLLAIYKSEKNVDGQEFVLLNKRKNLPYEDRQTAKKLAYLYVNSQQFEKLLPVCDELLEWYPENYKYYYFQAISYQKLKDEKKAEDSYRKVLELKPDDVKSNMNLGLILFFRANKFYDQTVKNYEAIQKPTDADYQKCKKKLNLARNQFRDAEPLLLKAYGAKPNGNVKKALFNLYNKTNQRTKAVQYR